MMNESELAEFKSQLEKHGPEKVQELLDLKKYGPGSSDRAKLAVTFVEQKKAEGDEAFRVADADRGAKAVGLADDANRIAKAANTISVGALKWAKLAVVLGGAALLLEVLGRFGIL